VARGTHHGTILCVEYRIGVLILGGGEFVFAAMMEKSGKAGHIVVGSDRANVSVSVSGYSFISRGYSLALLSQIGCCGCCLWVKHFDYPGHIP